ncbi:hypothetical protein GGR54DRAFT_644414 [Hypoxylon sp. NC1633]|nr:hypothetical protein GGR54DRAFT_644414 [Hypoxylon sp. NC1633]
MANYCIPETDGIVFPDTPWYVLIFMAACVLPALFMLVSSIWRGHEVEAHHCFLLSLRLFAYAFGYLGCWSVLWTSGREEGRDGNVKPGPANKARGAQTMRKRKERRNSVVVSDVSDLDLDEIREEVAKSGPTGQAQKGKAGVQAAKSTSSGQGQPGKATAPVVKTTSSGQGSKGKTVAFAKSTSSGKGEKEEAVVNVWWHMSQEAEDREKRLSKGKNVVSVKGGCLEGLDWKSAIHIWTKSAMIPIPEGSESYSEEPSESDYCGSQESLDQPPDAPGMLVGNGGWPTATDTEELAGLGSVKGACELSGPPI